MIDYKIRNVNLVKDIFSTLTESNVAVTGSSNYGNGNCFPNNKSDIDLIVIHSEELERFIKKRYHGPDCFSKISSGCFDVACVTAVLNDVRVSFNVFSEERYLRLCKEENTDLMVFKDLRGRGVGYKATASYYLSSFVKDFWLQYDIAAFEDGHAIKCPILNSNVFTINSFQEEILTQCEIADSGGLLFDGREILMKRVLAKAKDLKVSPLELHRVKSPFWSDEFTRLMRDRYGL